MSRGIDVGAARTALSTAVKTASGIKRAYPYLPDSISEIPCAFVGPPSVEYDKTFGRQGRTELMIPLTVVVGRHDEQQSQTRLDALISNLPLEGDGITVNDAVKAITGYALVRVVEARNAGQAEHGGTVYLAVDLMVQIVS